MSRYRQHAERAREQIEQELAEARRAYAMQPSEANVARCERLYEELRRLPV